MLEPGGLGLVVCDIVGGNNTLANLTAPNPSFLTNLMAPNQSFLTNLTAPNQSFLTNIIHYINTYNLLCNHLFSLA